MSRWAEWVLAASLAAGLPPAGAQPPRSASPGKSPAAASAYVQEHLRSGRYEIITRADAANFSAFEAAAKEAGLKHMPPVVKDTENDYPIPYMTVVDRGGKQYLRINDAAHEWTAHYAARLFNIPDERFAADIRNAQLVATPLADEARQGYEAAARRLGRQALPVYTDRREGAPLPEAGFFMTHGGQKFIRVNPAFERSLSPGEQAFVLAHELRHDGPNPAQAKADAHNDRSGALARQQEREADKGAAEATCAPLTGAKMLRRLAPSLPQDPLHPPPEERAQLLEKLAENLPAHCAGATGGRSR